MKKLASTSHSANAMNAPSIRSSRPVEQTPPLGLSIGEQMVNTSSDPKMCCEGSFRAHHEK